VTASTGKLRGSLVGLWPIYRPSVLVQALNDNIAVGGHLLSSNADVTLAGGSMLAWPSADRRLAMND